MQNEYTTAIGHSIINLLKKESYQVQYVSSAYYIDQKSNFSPTIEQWLSAICSAEIMVTSSFHGTLFALNFNIPFITIGNKDGEGGQNSRLYSLLEEFGLTERIISSYDKDKISYLLRKNIDWNRVNNLILERRLYSFDFLEKALS